MTATGEIVNITAPSEAKSGDDVTIRVQSWNKGNAAGTFQVKMYDDDNGGLVHTFPEHTLAAGASINELANPHPVMPSKDWNLVVKLYVDGKTTPDHTKTFTILLETAQVPVITSIGTKDPSKLCEPIQFINTIDWNDAGGTGTRKVYWQYTKDTAEYIAETCGTELSWTQFAGPDDSWPLHTFTEADADITHIRCIVENMHGNSACGMIENFTFEASDGFVISVGADLVGKELFVGKVYNIPLTDVWFYLAMYGFIETVGSHAQWASLAEGTYYKVKVGVDACTLTPTPDKVIQYPFGDVQACYGIFSNGDHVAIMAGDIGTNFINGEDVYQISGSSVKCVHKTTASTDPVYELFGSAVCDFFSISKEDCPLFLTEMCSDVVFVSNQLSIIKDHKDMYGEDHPPEWYDFPLLGLGMFGILSPGICEGMLLKNVGRKISGLIEQVKRFPSDFTEARHSALMDAFIRGTSGQIDAMVDAFKMKDWTTFDTAYNAIKATPIDPLSRLGRLKNWVDELYKRGYAPKSSADDVAKKSGILKKRAQTTIDYIRTKAPWIPGGQHGDDIGGVLTDAELPAFRKMMDEITTYFAEKGEYTRYIDPGEMAIYFRENPAFFKDGFTNALMDSTVHFDDAVEIGAHIKPLDEAGAAARRAEWHTFLDDLKQGLVDTFGEIRGKQLFDDLGLKAAEEAKEINKIIFMWGKSMWDDIFVKAKAAGATDEQATALAKIGAQSHINIVGGVNSGAYSTVANTKSGILGWIKQHPLGAVVGSTAFGMAVWYFLDNYTFHIWTGRAAGVLDKLFGDQADEATYRLKSASFQLKAHPCEPTVQQTFITLLTELKGLVEYCDTHDVIPTDKIPQYKELYKSVYGISIGNPNEMERSYIHLDYQFYIDEYVLTVRGAGCTDPIEPPDGWPPYEGTGLIKCTSNQAGFSVYLDGDYIDHSYGNTYLVIQNVPIGSHTVKIEKGVLYTPAFCAEDVEVIEGEITDFDCQMTKIGECSPVTSIIISITPKNPVKDEPVSFTGYATSGDPIETWEWDFGDGSAKEYGQTATHTYTRVEICTIKLTVTNDCENSNSAERAVTITETPIEESGTLLVKEPIDAITGAKCKGSWTAEIYVDGNTIGKTTQFSIPFGTDEYIGGYGGPCGDHTITIFLSDYDPVSKPVTINNGDTKSWQPEMFLEGANPDKGSILCQTTPVGAAIWISGVYRGDTNATIADIPAGATVVTFKKIGYEDCVKTVTVVKDSTVTASCTLVAEAEEYNVSFVVPNDALLYVDGKLIKTTTIGRLSTILRGLRR